MIRRVIDVYRTCLLALAVAACRDAPRLPEEPGLDGLRAHLDAARRDPAAAFATWELPADAWRGLVTEAYVEHRADYAAELARRRAAIAAEVRGWTGAAPRVQYADDPALSPGQVHARWILPVGRPGAVVDGIDAVFVHDGRRWRVLVDLDPWIAARAAAAVPGCDAAYGAMAPKGCQEWAWSIAEGALRDDAAGLTRACRQAEQLRCGR